jgi:hypothetical protein
MLFKTFSDKKIVLKHLAIRSCVKFVLWLWSSWISDRCWKDYPIIIYVQFGFNQNYNFLLFHFHIGSCIKTRLCSVVAAILCQMLFKTFSDKKIVLKHLAIGSCVKFVLWLWSSWISDRSWKDYPIIIYVQFGFNQNYNLDSVV